MRDIIDFSKHNEVWFRFISLEKRSFSDDVPKDYRQVSLTGVKQRFEDEAYQRISKEQMMGFRELCSLLGIPEVEQQLSGPDSPCLASQTSDIHTFLSSPTGNKRRREDTMETHRGSFVATPTAELSNPEETLLGDILDWSLDTSCSGYEGDQESEGEKDGEAMTSAVLLELSGTLGDIGQHCRALSSDDESLCKREDDDEEGDSCTLSADLHSSGYSSVQSASPPTSQSSCPLATLSLPPKGALVPALPGQPLPEPAQRARACTRRQVKRKNAAAHSGEETREEEDEETDVSVLLL